MKKKALCDETTTFFCTAMNSANVLLVMLWFGMAWRLLCYAAWLLTTEKQDLLPYLLSSLEIYDFTLGIWTTFTIILYKVSWLSSLLQNFFCLHCFVVEVMMRCIIIGNLFTTTVKFLSFYAKLNESKRLYIICFFPMDIYVDCIILRFIFSSKLKFSKQSTFIVRMYKWIFKIMLAWKFPLI